MSVRGGRAERHSNPMLNQPRITEAFPPAFCFLHRFLTLPGTIHRYCPRSVVRRVGYPSHYLFELHFEHGNQSESPVNSFFPVARLGSGVSARLTHFICRSNGHRPPRPRRCPRQSPDQEPGLAAAGTLGRWRVALCELKGRRTPVEQGQEAFPFLPAHC